MQGYDKHFHTGTCFLGPVLLFVVSFPCCFCLVNIFKWTTVLSRLPRWLSGKESAFQCRSCRRHGFDPWVREVPWRRKWQPTPVFLQGKSHGQRSLAGYSPWVHKEYWVTEILGYWVTGYWVTEHSTMLSSFFFFKSLFIVLQGLKKHMGNWHLYDVEFFFRLNRSMPFLLINFSFVSFRGF